MKLPNFMIIGAPKAGTTSLYHYLKQHPSVYMSPIKETNYYWYEGQRENRASVKTRAAYEALFTGVTTETAIGEASPQYLNSETAPDRILADFPDIKLIASLRQPVDRAYSAYYGWLRNGRGITSPRAALVRGGPFVEHSFYYPRLLRYFDRFPRSRIKMILFDDFVSDPAAVTRELFTFLDVDPTFAPDTRAVHNAAAVPRSPIFNLLMSRASSVRRVLFKAIPSIANGTGLLAPVQRAMRVPTPPMPDDLRGRLQALYTDDIKRTGELIGRDLSGWMSRGRQSGSNDAP